MAMYPRKNKAVHPADRHYAAQVARCVRYTAHIRLSPADSRRYEADTLADAQAKAQEWNAESKHGRRAVVYGITPEGVSLPI